MLVEATVAALATQRTAFAVPRDIAYFNTATMSPQLHRVWMAGEAALLRRGRPWSIGADDWFSDVERLRTLFAGLIGADADGIALVPATSYGFAVAARNLALHAGDRILVLAEDYPSGVYTWVAAARATGAEIVTVHRAAGRTWTEAILDAIDERVSVVSVPNVHWTDGSLIDLAAVAARTHEAGARLMIDGSQSIGVMPLDVAALRPDFVVTVGYKWLLGPVGVSYLYVAEQHRGGVPLEQLHAWQTTRVADALSEVTATIAAEVSALGLDPLPPHDRGPHLLGVRVPEPARAGLLPALAAAHCFAALRGETMRIAPHLHVIDADIERLTRTLARQLRTPIP